MDLTVSLSSVPGCGTHNVVLERLSATDDHHEQLIATVVSAQIGSADDADVTLDLRQAVASPVAGTLRFDRLVELCWYQPIDVAATLAFDAQVNDRYTEFCGTLGIHYGGTFNREQLGAAYIAELHTYDLDDPAEAAAVGDEAVYPEDFATIISDCRDLQRRDEPRYILSLVPRRAG